MYDRLVGSEINISGLLAYGLYKNYKRKKIKDFVEENKRQPTEMEIKGFVDNAMDFADSFEKEADEVYSISVTNSVVYSLRNSPEWEKLVATFKETVMQHVENEQKDYYNAIIPVAKKYGARWWQSILYSIVATLALPFILILFLMVASICFPSLISWTNDLVKSII